MDKNFNRRVLYYLIDIAKDFKPTLIMMFLFACIEAADVSYRPFLLKKILNTLTIDNNQDAFVTLRIPILLYLGAYFTIITLYRISHYYIEIKSWPQMRMNIAHQCLKLLLNKSFSFYQDNLSGSMSNKLKELSEVIPGMFWIFINSILFNFLTMTIAIITLWQVNTYFGLIMLIWSILFICCCFLISNKLNILSAEWGRARAATMGTLVDILSNILPVFIFTNKTGEENNFYDSLLNIRQADRNLQWFYFWIWLFYNYSFFILQVVEFYLLCKGYNDKLLTAGDFAFVLMINLSITRFLWQIAEHFADIAKKWGTIRQVLEMVFSENEIKDQLEAKELVVSSGEITFVNVGYKYKGKANLFNNISLTIRSGQKIGLVGYSGGGKSTFVNLILRLYELDEGNILIDNQNVKEVTQDSLRHNISIIPQDSSLFHRNVLENIRYGKITASDEEVYEAAKLANIHEFITALPTGYNTLVGERGLKLSGGQRQRIGIARAFLKNAPLLILDEATSSLDSLTEKYIQESFKRLMVNKTTIIIAHRLSTLLNVDRILVFKEGKIVEDGTHSELILNNSLYSILWNGQVGGFLADEITEQNIDQNTYKS